VRYYNEDMQLNAEKLRENLESLLYNREKTEKMRLNYSAFPIVNAGDLLANEGLSLN